MNAHVALAPRASRDLRKLRRSPDLPAVREALRRLQAHPAPDNADVSALTGAAPWLRLRVGPFRVLYRPLTDHELAELAPGAPAGFLVARIVNRRDLDEAIRSL